MTPAQACAMQGRASGVPGQRRDRRERSGPLQQRLRDVQDQRDVQDHVPRAPRARPHRRGQPLSRRATQALQAWHAGSDHRPAARSCLRPQPSDGHRLPRTRFQDPRRFQGVRRRPPRHRDPRARAQRRRLQARRRPCRRLAADDPAGSTATASGPPRPRPGGREQGCEHAPPPAAERRKGSAVRSPMQSTAGVPEDAPMSGGQ